MRKLKVLELFSGVGVDRMAMKNLDIDFEVVDIVENDRYAIKSYNAVHGTNFEVQDIMEWNKDIDVDLIFHGSPCQSISAAGRREGADKGSGTKSSLVWYSVDIIKNLMPKFVIWENVSTLRNKTNKHIFEEYLSILESLGYKNYYQTTSARDYGVPQSRRRVFTVSVLGNEEFNFPSPVKLDMFVQDLLEENVEDKYYLSSAMKKYISNTNEKWTGNNNGAFINKTIASTINTGEGSRRCDASNYFCEELPLNFNIQSIDNIDDYNIRKLTPLECGRLMNFKDEDTLKMLSVNSNTQVYKQTGNAIVESQVRPIIKEVYKIFEDSPDYEIEFDNYQEEEMDNDKRLKLWNRFNTLETHYSFLKSVVQNEMPKEFQSGAIDSFREAMLEFNDDLAVLFEDTIKFLKE